MKVSTPARIEIATGLLLAVLGFIVASTALQGFLRSGGRQVYYQERFSPAVAIACGRGYLNLPRDLTPSLDAFLSVRTQRFSCSDLPAKINAPPLNTFQAISRYLELVVAFWWRLTEVSWREVDDVIGLAFGLVIVITYGLFRAVFGRTLSLAGSVAMMLSPVHLVNMPHLRDYSKAPFLLAVLACGLWLTARPRRPRVVCGAALGLGAVLGVGLGFRNDLLIGVPPSIVLFGLLAPISGARPWLSRLAAVVLFCAAFAIAGYPILRAYQRNSNTPHVALLGLTTPFDENLRIRGTLYEFGYAYDDKFVALMVRGFVERTRPVDQFGPGAADYDAATTDYLLRIVRRFPADLCVRTYAAILHILRAPFFGITEAPTWLPSPLRSLVALRSDLISVMSPAWFLALIGLPYLVVTRTRLGAWVLITIIWFAGSGATQFAYRHVFYLEVLPLASLLIVAAGIGGLARALYHALYSARIPDLSTLYSAPWRRLAMVGAAGVVLPLLLLAGLRLYQTPEVARVVEGYLAAPITVVTPSLQRLDANRTRLLVPPAPQGAWPREMSLLVLEVTSACQVPVIPLTFRYENTGPSDFSHAIRVTAPSTGKTRIVFPVLHDEIPQRIVFAGVDLHTAALRCIDRVGYITDETSLDVPLVLNISPSWREGVLYQRLPVIDDVLPSWR